MGEVTMDQKIVLNKLLTDKGMSKEDKIAYCRRITGKTNSDLWTTQDYMDLVINAELGTTLVKDMSNLTTKEINKKFKLE